MVVRDLYISEYTGWGWGGTRGIPGPLKVSMGSGGRSLFSMHVPVLIQNWTLHMWELNETCIHIWHLPQKGCFTCYTPVFRADSYDTHVLSFHDSKGYMSLIWTGTVACGTRVLVLKPSFLYHFPGIFASVGKLIWIFASVGKLIYETYISLKVQVGGVSDLKNSTAREL